MKINTNSKLFRLPIMVALIVLVSGCATIFMDEAQIPGTNKYLTVGHDGGPFMAMWVLEGKEMHSVNIEQ